VFGYLAPLLKLPLPSDRLQQHLKSCPNLMRFVESIISIYLQGNDSAQGIILNAVVYSPRINRFTP
jgi:hypothetical protein